MYNLINKSQSAFRPSHSYETALNFLTNKRYKNMENLLDFCSMTCTRLLIQSIIMCILHKLASFGICQNTFKWFHSYPANRKQRVSWRDMLSHEKDISSGVPHESILRSSFLIFIEMTIQNVLNTLRIQCVQTAHHKTHVTNL